MNPFQSGKSGGGPPVFYRSKTQGTDGGNDNQQNNQNSQGNPEQKQAASAVVNS